MNILFLANAGQVIGWIALAVVIIFLVIVVIRSIVIVPQATTVIVERLGKYSKTLTAGFHIITPIIYY